MNALKVNLENCYGIKKLEQNFDFSKDRCFAIYAPNGSMKSSLAKVFEDIARGEASRDRIFPARATAREITDEDGGAIPPPKKYL